MFQAKSLPSMVIIHIILVFLQVGSSSSFISRLDLSVRSTSLQPSSSDGCVVTALEAVHLGPSESNNNASDTKKKKKATSKSKANKLLADFATASGEIVNPYQVLKVPRTAEKAEIKVSYRNLSRKYHPDGFMQRKSSGILPGSCNSLEDVREEWEKIKLSYEILTSKKMRARYDRNSAIDDPGAAMGRAAGQAALWGLAGVGKGIFKVGSAVGDMAFGNDTEEKDDE